MLTLPLPPRTGLRVLDDATVARTEVVRPGMCGHNALLVGQIGDWTWEAVSTLCVTDVLRARAPSGAATYLSFYYYRVRGSRRFHLRTPTFGDRLHVTTRLYGFGSESVLALHRIARSPAEGPSRRERFEEPFEPEDFYAFDDEDCLYVENFNRWVARSAAGSNEDLVRASPEGFRHEHLPTLPERFSPRLPCHRARTGHTFLDDRDGHAPEGATVRSWYEVDPSRDLNGVGLLYFASYFSVVDRALLDLWRHLGRSDAAFLDRVVVDQQLCYLANADAGTVVGLTARHRPGRAGGAREAVDVVLRDAGCERVLAVCTLQLETGTRT